LTTSANSSRADQSPIAFGSGVSTRPHLQAAEEACDLATAALVDSGVRRGDVDLAVVFVSGEHAANLRTLSLVIRHRLAPRCIIGVTGEGVVAGEQEFERTQGVAVLAGRLPGVEFTPFCSTYLPAISGSTEPTQTIHEKSPDDQADLAHLASAAGMKPGHRATLLFADPFSTPLDRLLPGLSSARALCGPAGGGRQGPIIGGLASASTRRGGNALLLNDRMFDAGLVGVSLGGPVRVDCVVSQGCRGFGPPMVVTSANGQLIRSLGGRPALEVLHELIELLSDDDRELLSRGLFIGRVVNEYKDRFGRDDFLIRTVPGVLKDAGAIAVSDHVRVGQTIRFHVRDARSADEDLAMLMDAQRLYDTPAGAILITCNGRGSRLFSRPNHDAAAVARIFDAADAEGAGEQLAKVGTAMRTHPRRAPLAGFFAAGEIGPVGNETYLHGQTACIALFRPPTP